MEEIIATDLQWLDKFDARNRVLRGKQYLLAKRVMDLVLVIITIPFWLPLYGIIALVIRITSPGAPVMFKQLRTGKGGRRFYMYKFRTMVPNAEELKAKYAHLNELQWPDFKITNDPRITKVGEFMRKTSLDEIPQLFNVLRGEMSIVGPRPTSFGPETYKLWDTSRLDVMPGLTGLWQIIGRAQLEFDDRLRLDKAYIERASLGLDITILIMTVASVFQSRGVDVALNRRKHKVKDQKDSMKNKTSNESSDNSIIGQVDEVYVDLKQVLNEIGKKFFKVSIGHPKLISKRFESSFVVQLYFEELASNVKMKIQEIVGESYTEHVYDTELRFGQVIKIKLFSPDIAFPSSIVKKLDSSVSSMTFLGKPLDTCQPGEHKVALSILDNKTDIEYQSETFTIKVVDFAFDHVSRPLVSRVTTAVLSVGSFAIFILTLLEQIDTTIGFTSGTAAGFLAVAVYANFYNLYQRIRPNEP